MGICHSNNKKLGTDFENDAVEILNNLGYWVHFITPDARGAQPFDIVASRQGKPIALDCKTCVAKTFNISRLEDNQITSFDKWLRCGNPEPVILVKHKGYIHCVSYSRLKAEGSVALIKNPYNELEVQINNAYDSKK